MAAAIAKLVGLGVTLAAWNLALKAPFGPTGTMAMIWGAPCFVYPITLVGRRVLDSRPGARQAEWANIFVHYAMMISLGVGIFPAVQFLSQHPTSAFQPLKQVGFILTVVTGALALLTVLNLAVRGLGAPFALRLSSRLASDWMYAWTRNPMVLATLAFLFSVAVMYRSVWFLLYVAVCLSPGLIFFVKWYEERELELRFGPSYMDYKAKTPMIWPRRPRPAERDDKAAA